MVKFVNNFSGWRLFITWRLRFQISIVLSSGETIIVVCRPKITYSVVIRYHCMVARKDTNKISSPLRISPLEKRKVAWTRDARRAKLTTWSRFSRAMKPRFCGFCQRIGKIYQHWEKIPWNAALGFILRVVRGISGTLKTFFCSSFASHIVWVDKGIKNTTPFSFFRINWMRQENSQFKSFEKKKKTVRWINIGHIQWCPPKWSIEIKFRRESMALVLKWISYTPTKESFLVWNETIFLQKPSLKHIFCPPPKKSKHQLLQGHANRKSVFWRSK